MYGYIYKTTNLINNKIYIGQKHSSKFLGQSYLGSGKRLKEAVNKYGKESFKVELIEEVETKEMMDEREIYWISYYHATNKEIGYNLSEGGNVNRTLVGENNPFYGKHFSEETLKHLSEVRKGKKLGPWSQERREKEYLRRMSEDRILQRIEYENTQIQRIQQEILLKQEKLTKHLNTLNYLNIVLEKKRNQSPLTKERISKAISDGLKENAKHNPNYGMRGKHVSEETKQKLRLAHLGKSKKSKGFIHITNDIEDKMINPSEFEIYEKQGWRKGRKKFSQEACKNISDGHKGHSSYNKNFIWITNGIEDRCIDKNELDNFDKSIWTRGRTNARGRKA